MNENIGKFFIFPKILEKSIFSFFKTLIIWKLLKLSTKVNIIKKLALTSSLNKENDYSSIKYFILSWALDSVDFNIRQIALI